MFRSASLPLMILSTPEDAKPSSTSTLSTVERRIRKEERRLAALAAAKLSGELKALSLAALPSPSPSQSPTAVIEPITEKHGNLMDDYDGSDKFGDYFCLFNQPAEEDSASSRPIGKVSIAKELVSDTMPFFENDHIVDRDVTYELYREVQGSERDEIIRNRTFRQKMKINTSACREGEAAVMPCLRLSAAEKEYKEPLRDRDKNWVQTSGRAIMKSDEIAEIATEKEAVDLGCYLSESMSNLMWAPTSQNLIRRQQLVRTSSLISETRCIVSIYGVGITGRLVSVQPSVITIEAYSIWNSEKYTLELTGKELKQLLILSGHERLLKVGLKNDAIQHLLKLLYFSYTGSITSHDK
jgi:hypothetical protein